jgi:hypothetical protein
LAQSFERTQKHCHIKPFWNPPNHIRTGNLMQAKAEICKEMNHLVQILKAPIRHPPPSIITITAAADCHRVSRRGQMVGSVVWISESHAVTTCD